MNKFEKLTGFIIAKEKECVDLSNSAFDKMKTLENDSALYVMLKNSRRRSLDRASVLFEIVNFINNMED